MLSLQEFKSLSNAAKSEYLRYKSAINVMSLSKRKLIYKVGINDADYKTHMIIGDKKVRCPAYSAWANMLKRALSKIVHKKQPYYIGVTICREWHSFMAFRAWWLESHVDGWQLDKDLLTDSREYSPESCIYVPSWLNSFNGDRAAARGDFPIGVSRLNTNGKYMAYCKNQLGYSMHIGYFFTPEEAYEAWKARKLEIAAQLKHRMDEIDLRIYPRVVEIIKRAK